MRDFFTKQEKIFILFLLSGIMVGAGIELYQFHFRPNGAISTPEVLDEMENQIESKAVLIDSIVNNEIDSFIDEKSLAKVSKAPLKSRYHHKPDRHQLLIEINAATVEELVQLPQVGPVLAKRIVEYRLTYGPFKSIDDLRGVKGIGDKKLTSISPFIYIKSE